MSAPVLQLHPDQGLPLLGLSGFAGSGKSTAAGLLEQIGWERRSYKTALVDLLVRMDPWLPDGRRARQVLAEVGYERAKAEVPGFRDLLIGLGHGARQAIADDVWVRKALDPARLSPVVIDDVRYANEAQAVFDRGGLVFRIERPGVGAARQHPSETELADWPFDAVLRNAGDMEHLRRLLWKALLMHGVRSWPAAARDASPSGMGILRAVVP